MPPRILPLEKGHNFRELGGYQTKDGRTLKWHKVLRSASLAHLTSHDLTYLTHYGVRYDIDFRSPEEIAKSPDKVPENATYESLPVFKIDETASTTSETDLFKAFSTDPQSGHQHMIQVYGDLINQAHSKQAYRHFFDLLLANDQEDQTLLFHCTAGKDRTGMGAVFLLSALGVPEETIRTDYLLTNQASAAFVTQSLTKLQQKTQNQAVFQSYQSLLTVHQDYFDTAKQAIEAANGSIQNYLTHDLQLSQHDLADLRKIYLA